MLTKIKNSAFTSGSVCLLSLSALAVATPCYALSFNLNTWSTIGDVSTTSTQATIKTGTNNTVLTDGGNGSLQAFLNINPSDLDNAIANTSYGSAIKTTTSANIGDILSFNWNFVPSDSDQAFVTINNSVVALTGSSTFNYSFTSAGNYTIGIGAVDVNDSIGVSTLTVSNVSLTAVPWDIPGGATIPSLGAIFAFGFMRKFHTLVRIRK